MAYLSRLTITDENGNVVDIDIPRGEVKITDRRGHELMEKIAKELVKIRELLSQGLHARPPTDNDIKV